MEFRPIWIQNQIKIIRWVKKNYLDLYKLIKCGPTCKHNKRSADLEEIEIAKGVFLSEDQTPGTGVGI